MNRRVTIQPLSAIFISLFALLVATVALYIARESRELALSEVTVEDRNSLITPVFDQEKQKWSYLAVWEESVTNQSGPPISLIAIERLNGGSGFLISLLGQKVVNANIPYTPFLCERSIADIRANPRILKGLMQKGMGESSRVDLLIPSGESKTIRPGIALQPYDDNNRLLANMILVSFRLRFSNGKTYILRRGFPIQPIRQ